MAIKRMMGLQPSRAVVPAAYDEAVADDDPRRDVEVDLSRDELPQTLARGRISAAEQFGIVPDELPATA